MPLQMMMVVKLRIEIIRPIDSWWLMTEDNETEIVAERPRTVSRTEKLTKVAV